MKERIIESGKKLIESGKQFTKNNPKTVGAAGGVLGTILVNKGLRSETGKKVTGKISGAAKTVKDKTTGAVTSVKETTTGMVANVKNKFRKENNTEKKGFFTKAGDNS